MNPEVIEPKKTGLTDQERLELFKEWKEALGTPEFPRHISAFKQLVAPPGNLVARPCFCAVGVLLELTLRKYPDLIECKETDTHGSYGFCVPGSADLRTGAMSGPLRLVFRISYDTEQRIESANDIGESDARLKQIIQEHLITPLEMRWQGHV